MLRRPPTSTRTDTLFPYTTLFRSPPAALDIGLVRGGEAIGHHHALRSPARAHGIAQPVERRPFARGKRADPVEHRIDHVRAGAGEARLGRQRLDADDVIEHEALIGNGGRSEAHTFELQSLTRTAYAVV